MQLLRSVVLVDESLVFEADHSGGSQQDKRQETLTYV